MKRINKLLTICLCMAAMSANAYWGEKKDQHTSADFNFDRLSVDFFLKPNQKLVTIAYEADGGKEGTSSYLKFLTRPMREGEVAECYLIEGWSYFDNLPAWLRPRQHKVCEKKEEKK